MEKMLFALSLALLCTAVVGQTTCEGSYNPPGVDWSAAWTLSSDYRYANFTVMAVTDGWLAIGFSLNRMMANTDMVIGVINAAGTEYSITDRYADSQALPPVDDNQNITNLRIERRTIGAENYTIMSFTRPVCSNNANDLALSEDPYILFAWGSIMDDDINRLMGHMSPTDRGASMERFDFICNADQGGFDGVRAGIAWVISWEISPDARYATFRISAQTSGWVGIGFSEDNEMPSTDVIIGASDGVNMSYVSDRYAISRTAPAVDDSQDLTYEGAEQIGTAPDIFTNVNFTRRTYTGDGRDISLNDSPIYILVAWGPETDFDASNPASIQRHTDRAVLPGTYTFFTCGVLIVEPDDVDVTTAAPTTAEAAATTEGAAAITVTTSLMLILALIAMVNF